ncbi:MAG TPA: nitroreductase family protein [Thermoplasmatales archaeon]|nr:nitroreductase family protein [Thermoplasmatales archaeon]
MELKEVIMRRCSVRSFKETDFPLEIVTEILEYANMAPSAGNLQARDFIVVTDDEIKYELASAAFGQMFIVEAPVVVVACANLKRIAPYGKRGEDLYCLQDATAAIEHILLMATDFGLGSCWVGAFNENKVSEILNLPSYIRPVAIIPLGYSDEKESESSRMDIKELIHYNKW